MFTTKYNTIEDFAENFTKGSFGLYAVTYTPVKVNVNPRDKDRSEVTSDEKNKYTDRVMKLTVYRNACTGIDYYNAVKGECEREGIIFNDNEFEVAFPKKETYTETISTSLKNIVLQKKDSTQRYLRLLCGRKPTKVKSFTFLDGQLATEEEIADINRYIAPHKESAKQEALSMQNIIGVRNVKLENVLFLGQGSKYWENPNYESVITHESLWQMFQ